MTRDDIITSAEKFIGVRWHHQGRLPEVALDCIGLLSATAMDCGSISEPAPANYPRDPDGTFLQEFRNYGLLEIMVPQMLIADIGVFVMSTRPCHCGILTTLYDQPAIVHAHAGHRKVTIETLESVEATVGRMTHAFQFPGVE